MGPSLSLVTAAARHSFTKSKVVSESTLDYTEEIDRPGT
jgi:hypothetical protein